MWPLSTIPFPHLGKATTTASWSVYPFKTWHFHTYLYVYRNITVFLCIFKLETILCNSLLFTLTMYLGVPNAYIQTWLTYHTGCRVFPDCNTWGVGEDCNVYPSMCSSVYICRYISWKKILWSEPMSIYLVVCTLRWHYPIILPLGKDTIYKMNILNF